MDRWWRKIQVVVGMCYVESSRMTIPVGLGIPELDSRGWICGVDFACRPPMADGSKTVFDCSKQYNLLCCCQTPCLAKVEPSVRNGADLGLFNLPSIRSLDCNCRPICLSEQRECKQRRIVYVRVIPYCVCYTSDTRSIIKMPSEIHIKVVDSYIQS